MIEETGRVVAVEAGRAWVEVNRRSACGGCSVSGGCGTAGIARYLGRKGSVRMRVLDPVGVRAGDRVVIGMQEGAMLRGMIRVYAVPLAAMLLGAFGGEMLAQALALEGRDLGALLGGGLGLAAGLFNVRIFSRRIAGDPAYQPVILRRVEAMDAAPLVFAGSVRGRH